MAATASNRICLAEPIHGPNPDSFCVYFCNRCEGCTHATFSLVVHSHRRFVYITVYMLPLDIYTLSYLLSISTSTGARPSAVLSFIGVG